MSSPMPYKQAFTVRKESLNSKLVVCPICLDGIRASHFCSHMDEAHKLKTMNGHCPCGFNCWKKEHLLDSHLEILWKHWREHDEEFWQRIAVEVALRAVHDVQRVR